MKKTFFAILKALGYSEKVKAGTDLTSDEIKKLDEECQKQLKMSFKDALVKAASEPDDTELKLEEDQKRILKELLGKEIPEGANPLPGNKANDQNSTEQIIAGITDLKTKNEDLLGRIKKLEADPEPGASQKKAASKVIPIKGGAHSKTHLFGIETPFFDLKKPWNAVAMTRKPLEIIAATNGLQSDWKEYESEFKQAVNAYGKSFAETINRMLGEGRLNIKMTDIDFTGFEDTGWGETYIIRRQEALVAYIRSLNNITGIFSVRYGVQNKEELSNAFLTSFSSAFVSGRNFKGSVAVAPIEAQVFDLMIKHKFENLKDLEKQYIGYLNREGSDPMKWSWIEWMIKSILEVAMNEWVTRRIIGYRIEPVTDYYRHSLHGSNGVLTQLRLWAAEFRLKPFAGFTYTQSTMLAAVEGFVAEVYKVLPSMTSMRLHFNQSHTPWYTKGYRKEYGLEQDFNGNTLKLIDYPNVEMVAVPNMGSSCMMFITVPGNIELIENQAGEMEKFWMQRDMDELLISSNWKEGVTAYMVGKKFDSAADLTDDSYKNQYIFLTDDSIDLDADATTADATKGHCFNTVENTGATTLTDIENAPPGVVYRVNCASTTNATQTAKADKFSLVDAWIPTAIGDYLEVYLYDNPDDSTDVKNGKFINVARLVSA
jgi:hypothetical protein